MSLPSRPDFFSAPFRLDKSFSLSHAPNKLVENSIAMPGWNKTKQHVVLKQQAKQGVQKGQTSTSKGKHLEEGGGDIRILSCTQMVNYLNLRENQA